MRNLLLFPIVCFSVVLLSFLSTADAHHDGRDSKSTSKANPELQLSDDDEHILKKHFIEIPSTVLNAENFSGIPVNDANSELYMYQNKFILLNFWATWCVPCLKELPDMEELHQKLGKKGLVILAVAMGEDKQKIERFLKRHELSFPIMADPDMEISQLYGVQNLPVTFLIAPNKMILGRAIGPREWKKTDLVKFFQKRIAMK